MVYTLVKSQCTVRVIVLRSYNHVRNGCCNNCHALNVVVATGCGDRMQQQVTTTIVSYILSVRDRYSRPIVIIFLGDFCMRINAVCKLK